MHVVLEIGTGEAVPTVSKRRKVGLRDGTILAVDVCS
jgi:hypothetical protein